MGGKNIKIANKKGWTISSLFLSIVTNLFVTYLFSKFLTGVEKENIYARILHTARKF